uniref:Uncharacterized protein n=1 Tax=Haplochromis burtoni TaxID=8153 RepID=A0A3Q2VP94_HAPBU
RTQKQMWTRCCKFKQKAIVYLDDCRGAMASQIAKVLLSLDAEAVGSLKEGVNFKKSTEDGKCYIIFKSNNDFKACKNQCKHQGGLFIKDIEDLDGM